MKHKRRNDGNDLITKDRARQYAMNKAELAYQGGVAICFRTLLDKHGWTTEDVLALSNNMVYTAESIRQGRATVMDYIYSLRDENGICFKTIYPDKI